MDTMNSLLRRVLSVSVTTFAFTTATFAVYILAFGLVRAVAFPILFQVPLVSRLLRPFLGHFLRGRWSLVYLWRNRQLVWHTFLLGVTTVEGWEFAESLFDNKVQEVRSALFEAWLCLKVLLYSPWLSCLTLPIPYSHLYRVSQAVIHITYISAIWSFAHSQRMIAPHRVLKEVHYSAIRNTTRPFGQPSCVLLCSPLERTIKYFFAVEPPRLRQVCSHPYIFARGL
jgi:hypothetical protein